MKYKNKDVLPLRMLALVHQASAEEYRSFARRLAGSPLADAYLIRSKWHEDVAAECNSLAAQLVRRKGEDR